MLRYEKKIREIIASHLNVTSIDSFDSNGDLRSIGMDSISFVAIVVAIENEFDIEFPNDKFLISESGTIYLLSQIVEDILCNKNYAISK